MVAKAKLTGDVPGGALVEKKHGQFVQFVTAVRGCASLTWPESWMLAHTHTRRAVGQNHEHSHYLIEEFGKDKGTYVHTELFNAGTLSSFLS